MNQLDASRAGTFLLDEKTPVHRLGFGAMRITGDGAWGEHADPQRCLQTLADLPRLGVNLIDTADAYGPVVSEQMIRKALHPYPEGLIIATKGGQVRPGPGVWVPLGRPEYLEQQVKMSLRWLGLERIDLWQLHRIDPNVPREEQFDCIGSLQKQGYIRHAGLSEVSVDDIRIAQRYFPVATVQNRYSIDRREHDDVLAYCEDQRIGFIPWSPLSRGLLAQATSPLHAIAREHDVQPGQIALAWLLQRSPVMLPIPGTSRPEHLQQNVAAAAITLSADECARIAAMADTGPDEPQAS